MAAGRGISVNGYSRQHSSDRLAAAASASAAASSYNGKKPIAQAGTGAAGAAAAAASIVVTRRSLRSLLLLLLWLVAGFLLGSLSAQSTRRQRLRDVSIPASQRHLMMFPGLTKEGFETSSSLAAATKAAATGSSGGGGNAAGGEQVGLAAASAAVNPQATSSGSLASPAGGERRYVIVGLERKESRVQQMEEEEEGEWDPEADPLIRRKMVMEKFLREQLEGMQAGLPIVGTIANAAFIEMLDNWLYHVRKAGMKNVLVASLDDDLYQWCMERNVSSIRLRSHMTKKNFRVDMKQFQNMGALKTAFLLSVLEQGWDLIMSDTDVVWLRNPAAFFHRDADLGRADIMVTSDSVSHSNDMISQTRDPFKPVNGDKQGWFRNATKRAKEIFGNAYEHAFNTGVLFLRSTPPTISFSTSWHHAMRTRGKSQGWERIWGDQHAFNQLHRIKMFPIKVVAPIDGQPHNNRIFWTHNFTVKLAVLPVALFCNGHIYFAQRVPQQLGIDPFVVHNTFQYHYAPGKVSRFREAGLWSLDPPEYFEEGNFVSFDVTAPDWVQQMEPGWPKHQAAMSYYYEAMRKAYAIAWVLGRFLILPRVTCYCDKWWDSLTVPCRAPGGDYDPPFECPIDYLINPFYWGHTYMNMRYRPKTFLTHPLVSKEIKESRVTVAVDYGEVKSEQSNNEPVVYLPPNGTDNDIRSVLLLQQHRVIHLSNIMDSFCRFSDEKQNAKFDRFTYRFFYQEWCCTPKIGVKQVVNITILELSKISPGHCTHEPLQTS